MKVKFRDVKLSPANRQRLQQINSTNQQKEYSKLSTLLKEGRMSGIVDWNAIEDRLREVDTPSAWSSPKSILESALHSYRKNRMEGQDNYIEVWVEKDALSGVLSRVTYQYGIPIMVNRGYSSASAMYQSYLRFRGAIYRDQEVKVLYLGDFDPSGIDMIRDVRERTREFLLKTYFDEHEPDHMTEEESSDRVDAFMTWFKTKFEIIPIALTRDQIDEYDPPENPAKRTDPRSKEFIDRHGTSSWEVDALRPEVLNQILTDAIEERIDPDTYNDVLKEEEADKKKLQTIINKNYKE